MQLFAEKGDFSKKKRPKKDLKSGLGLLRDPGLPKRDPVGSSAWQSKLIRAILTYQDNLKLIRAI